MKKGFYLNKINNHNILIIFAILAVLIIPSLVASQAAAGYEQDYFTRRLLEGQAPDLENGCYNACEKAYTSKDISSCRNQCFKDFNIATYSSALAYCEYLSSYLSNQSVQDALSKNFNATVISYIAPDSTPGDANQKFGVYALEGSYITFGSAIENYGIKVPESFSMRYLNLSSQGLITINGSVNSTLGADVRITSEYLNKYYTCLNQSTKLLKDIEIQSKQNEEALRAAEEARAARQKIIVTISFLTAIISLSVFFIIKKIKKRKTTKVLDDLLNKTKSSLQNKDMKSAMNEYTVLKQSLESYKNKIPKKDIIRLQNEMVKLNLDNP